MMAAAPVRLEYDALPAVVPSYVRAATTLSGGLSGDQTIPEIVAELPSLQVSQDALTSYREVCCFADSKHLPVTYPHVLAFPMHMAVMTHKQFPLKLLGLIHVRNQITQHRAIGQDETLRLEVRVGGHRETSKGVEFDLTTRVHDSQNQRVWEEIGTMLSRQKTSQASDDKGNSKKTQHDEMRFKGEHSSDWQIPADIGRRYARAAGDYNPIHLSPYTAKLFGFPRAIATGMWTKARAAAQLTPQLEQDAYTLSLAFKKPIFLPSKARFDYSLSDSGAEFALTNIPGDVLHLSGDVRYI